MKSKLTEAAKERLCDGEIYFGAGAEDRERFASALEYVTEAENRRSTAIPTPHVGNSSGIEGGTNIGGLGERTLHLVLKYMAEPNREFHEIKCGKFFADIRRKDEITEVQTRNLYSMRKKLAAFVSDGTVHVTIVHPIVESKTLIWVDPESGELSGFRKSPKSEDVFGAFRELSSLGELLKSDRLSFVLPVLRCDEYKLKCGRSRDGKKFGAARINRIPTEYIGEYRFSSPKEFVRLLPPSLLGAPFTVKSAAAAVGTDARRTYSLLRSLLFADVLIKSGKDSRADLYVLSNHS